MKNSRRTYITGLGTAAEPYRYKINEEFLQDVEAGRWVEGMLQAMVNEIRWLQYELALERIKN